MASSRMRKMPGSKKEKVFHPESRKAGQLARRALRKSRLNSVAIKRGKKRDSLLDIYGFFYHAALEEGVMTLEELHDIVQNIWLKRHDKELEAERVARRKGRPKSTREIKLEEIKLREEEEYRTGMEVPDLTHAPTVELFKRWDQKDVTYTQLLRFIRISNTDPRMAVVSRPGKHVSILQVTKNEDQQMDVEAQSTPTRPSLPFDLPPDRFASTIMSMDGPM